MIFRLSRLRSERAKGPGIFFVLFCVDEFISIDLRTVGSGGGNGGGGDGGGSSGSDGGSGDHDFDNDNSSGDGGGSGGIGNGDSGGVAGSPDGSGVFLFSLLFFTLLILPPLFLSLFL